MACETRWGTLSSGNKVALLLHGLSSASQSWHAIAQGLVQAGYYVIAPDLLGHGFSPRSNSYKLEDFASHIASTTLTEAVRPHLVVGHSLGCLVACALKQLHTNSSSLGLVERVVLIDPPLDLSDDRIDAICRAIVDEVSHPAAPQEYLRNNPNWTERDAVAKTFGATLCEPDTVKQVVNDLKPWSHTGLLNCWTGSDGTDDVPPTELIVLGADPTKGAVFLPHEALALERSSVSPQQGPKFAFVTGTTHSVHREEPRIVLDVCRTGKVTGVAGLVSAADASKLGEQTALDSAHV